MDGSEANWTPPLPLPTIQKNGKPLIGSHNTDSSQLNLHPDHGSKDVASHTKPSTIDDGGEEKRLEDSTDTGKIERIAPDEIVSHAGGQFEQTQSAYPSELESLLPDRPPLSDQLRDAMVHAEWRPGGSSQGHATDDIPTFLPSDMLEKIVTKTSVEAELRACGMRGESTIARLVSNILNIESIHSKNDKNAFSEFKLTKTTRKKLFAILVLTGHVLSILDLVDEKIFDLHLPFMKINGKLALQGHSEHQGAKIASFSRWDSRGHDLFYIYQWQMLAPWFVLSSKEQPKVLKYSLHAKIPLPFIKNLESDETQDLATSGGFGDVQRVTIHPAHYKVAGPSGTSFAIKTLKESSSEALKAEADNMRRLMRDHNPHLTRLLVTVEHGYQGSLVFPWAEGNLLEFWGKEVVDPNFQKPDPVWIRWMAKQFSGLASVLKLVHESSVVQEGNNLELPPDPTQMYGRHGDLKPENILWFVGPEHEDEVPTPQAAGYSGPLGILKVADFGLTTFNSKRSMKARASKTARSRTHRAPEYDGDEVTPSADLWSFGCILLEFLVWSFDGMKGVDDFSRLRADEERTMNSQYVEDKFFYGRSSQSIVKTTVTDMILDLRTDLRCSEFCHEVLDLIENGLLKVNPDSRLKCDRIYDSLKEIHQNAMSNEAYCTTRSTGAYTTQEDYPTSSGPSFATEISDPPLLQPDTDDEVRADANKDPPTIHTPLPTVPEGHESRMEVPSNTLNNLTPLVLECTSSSRDRHEQNEPGQVKESFIHKLMGAFAALFSCKWL